MFSTNRPAAALTRIAIAGAIVAAPLTALAVPAFATPPARVSVTDPRDYNFADCAKPERRDDTDFQNWCAAIRWANNPANPLSPTHPKDSWNDPSNPNNPNSPLNPNNPNNLNNPNNPASPLNPNNPANPNSPNNPANPNSPMNPNNPMHPH
nr:hypothetical protein [Nocardia panacis]